MDDRRFDRLARSLARDTSRRAALAGLVAGAAGLLVGGRVKAADWPGIVDLSGIYCGGIAGIPCPSGYECVDDPADVCDPAAGGADCSGRCRRLDAYNPCAAILCIEGSICCPNCGGICVPAGVACSDELCQGEGEPCGPTRCAPGEVCCNESCGICTPPDGFCTMQYCLPADAAA